MSEYKYTPKQEAFCQAYVRLGNMTDAYREAYNASKMQQNTVGVKASTMLKEDKYSVRVKQIRDELEDRNRITIDELVKDLANMIRFDPADMYTEVGELKAIHDMPKPVRQMISSLDVDEIYEGVGRDKIEIGQIKKIRLYNKLDAIEKLMKHLGAYEKDNNQKTPSEVIIFQLPDNGRK
jgi:phage terminase small subunit